MPPDFSQLSDASLELSAWTGLAFAIGLAIAGVGFLIFSRGRASREAAQEALAFEELDLIREQRRRLGAHSQPSTLDEKVAHVANMSRDLARLNSEIRQEFELQMVEVKRLQTDATNAREVASLSDQALSAAEALVASQMERALTKAGRADRLFQIVVAIISFVVGIGATLIIQAITGA